MTESTATKAERQPQQVLRRLGAFLMRGEVLAATYLVVAIAASIQAVLLGNHEFGGRQYTEYNNYVIFKQSFFHLLQGRNLYVLFPDEQWDLYKYSPTFALAMGSLAYLPDWLGLTLWNALNALALYWGISSLPLSNKVKQSILWFVLLELLTSIQNAQSNGLLAGLMLLAFGSYHKGHTGKAALWLVAATFIKVYGAIGFSLFLLFPQKPSFIWKAAAWTVLFAVVPLVVPGLGIAGLAAQYKNWTVMMAADQSASYGLSVMGWLHTWFGVNGGKGMVTVVGLVLFLLPFARIGMLGQLRYQLLLLASMLIWVIIFNHKAESPTFVIAAAGAGLWYYTGEKTAFRRVAIVLFFIFTCMSPTDLFPRFVRDEIFKPYVVKAVPGIFLWVVVLWDLMTFKPQADESSSQPALA